MKREILFQITSNIHTYYTIHIYTQEYCIRVDTVSDKISKVGG